LLRPGIFWGLMLYVSFGALWIVASDSALSALRWSCRSGAFFALDETPLSARRAQWVCRCPVSVAIRRWLDNGGRDEWPLLKHKR